MNAKPKSRILLVITLALIVALPLMLSACGPAADELIRNAIIEEFDEIKVGENANFNEGLDIAFIEGGFEEIGIDGEEFKRLWMDGFDYSINDITVYGKTATASLTFTRKSIEDAVSIFNGKSAEYLAELEALTAEDPNALNDFTDERILSDHVDMFMDALAVTPGSSVDVELRYELIDKVWTPTEESATAMLGKVFS